MPEKAVINRVRKDARAGKAPSTQAGEFVREEFHHIREGKHGARSTRQAIAIGLSKARRAGVNLPPPKPGTTSPKVRQQAEHESALGRSSNEHTSPKRSRAVLRALKRESDGAASPGAISRHAHASARRRTPAQRSAAGRKAAATRKER